MGLWLLDECRRVWAEGGECPSYEALVSGARRSDVRARIDVSDPRFFAPEDMVAEIRQACIEKGLTSPSTPGDYAKVIFDSLAESFRASVFRLSEITGFPAKRLRVVGGGSRNRYLCAGLADRLGVPVVAGPPEATAAGNALLQALAVGIVTTTEELRSVAARSFSPAFYSPSGA
jgi:rhamnulokinase